jgi:hypothetical protein
MSQISKDALWDVAPGVVHQLGNVLFTLQGRATLLPQGSGRDQMLDAVRRAQEAAQVLRWAIGDGLDQPVAAGSAVPRILDAMRTGYRERGIALQCTHASGDVAVDPILLTRLLASACQAMTHGFSGGSLTVQCREDQGMLWIGLEVLAASGALPFPIQGERLAAELADVLGAWDGRLTVESSTEASLWLHPAPVLGTVFTRS